MNVFHVNEGADVIAFHRTDGAGDDTIVVANLGASHFTEYLLGAPIVGEWFELANGDDARFGGDGRVNQVKIASDEDRDGFTATLNLELAPYTLFILSTEAPSSGLNSGLILR